CANLGPGEGITPGAITLPEELRSPDLYPPAKTDAGLSRPECTVLFIFRSLYLCAIGLWPVFSFRRNLPPILSSIPKLLDSSKELYIGSASDYTGLSPSMAPRSRGLRRCLTKSFLYKLQLGPKPDFKFELHARQNTGERN
ncbi:hypothetical protein KEM54_002514, partial [Ascosphaera aggregata]